MRLHIIQTNIAMKKNDAKEACMLLLENAEWQFLVQNRETISKAWEMWWFFWGASIMQETPEDCIKREIKEELNIELENFTYIWFVYAFSPSFNIRIKRNFFYAQTQKKAEDFEVLEWDYCTFKSFDEIKKMHDFMWKWDAIEVVEKIVGAYKWTHNT